MSHAPSLPDCPSPSAFRVALSRAIHQVLDEPRVFDDAFALPILGADAAARIDPFHHNGVAARSMRAGIVARSRFAEDRLQAAIEAGTRQYALLGAGLDTWALRAARFGSEVRVFELDQAAMQAWKAAVLEANGWRKPVGLEWVEQDLRHGTVPDALAGSGADLSAPVAIAILGVLVYLGEEDVTRLLSSLGRFAPGSTLVLDYRLQDELLPPMDRMMMRATAEAMAAGGEPWRSSSDPDRMRALLSDAGFDVEQDLGPADLNARYFDRRRDGLQIAGGGFRHLSAIKRR
ncbi:class I SAM-dependent methyltransferase [Pseudoxanthomonas suwonensis]|uniref:class I SAM-dependent methyltransferase n=1 Tax=Pseudoxanthomonas suwonensis TaxID=314722 RepID=UPI00048D104E|nr:SAM-dependent methyltransferase [Pseudoxanthomonas suwonensis]